MCKLVPDHNFGYKLECFQDHHHPVVLEIWLCNPPLPQRPGEIGREIPPMDLLVSTLTDLDDAKVIAAKTYALGGTIAIARDWFTGEQFWLKTPKKRRQHRYTSYNR